MSNQVNRAILVLENWLDKGLNSKMEAALKLKSEKTVTIANKPQLNEKQQQDQSLQIN